MLHDIEAFVIRPVACGLGIVSQRDLFTGTVVLKEAPILRAATLQAACAEVKPELLYPSSHGPEKIPAPPEVINRFAGPSPLRTQK